jgi:hypothetical protein
MPNKTVRANARPTPKSPPEPGSPESIRSQAADLKSVTALLKEARPLIERLEGELGLDEPNDAQQPAAEDHGDLESAVLDVRTWASIAWELWTETRFNAEMDDDDSLARERIDRVLEQVHEAAEELHRAYYGKLESEGRAAQ